MVYKHFWGYYFWVKMSKEERFKKAIELIEKGIGIERACHEAGISTATFYKLKESEPYSTMFKNAREKALKMQGERQQKYTELLQEGIKIKEELFHEPGEKTFRLGERTFLTQEGRKRMDHARVQVFSFLSEIEKKVDEIARLTFFDWWKGPFIAKEITSLLFELRRNLWEWDEDTDIIIKSAEQIEIAPKIENLVKKAEENQQGEASS